MHELLRSDIFCHPIEAEDYPLIHTNSDTFNMPFNSSIFQLRGTYDKVFGKMLDEDQGNLKEKKMYKIKYTLNLLPKVTYKPGSDESTGMNELMELLGNTSELEIFRSKVIEDFFNFQWDNYAKHLHYYGASVHLVYVIMFSTYVNIVYNNRNFEARAPLCWSLLICLMYPMIYDCL